MGARSLKIPEDVVASRHIPPDELEDVLHKELALALYQRGMLSSGKAAALSGMTTQQFEDLLGKRKIMRPYGEEELEEDLEYVRSGL
jgi:predicted HTH domain antitoxin